MIEKPQYHQFMRLTVLPICISFVSNNSIPNMKRIVFSFQAIAFLIFLSALTLSCSKSDDAKPKGTLSVYAYTLKNGYMDIRVDDLNGTPTTLNTTLVSPFKPECGANTTATLSLSAGTHTLYFYNGANTYHQDYTVIADSCQLILKNF